MPESRQAKWQILGIQAIFKQLMRMFCEAVRGCWRVAMLVNLIIKFLILSHANIF